MERKPWEPPYEFDEYRLVQRLGAGRMGVVYLANDRLLDRAVAIKFLTSKLTETARQRFVIEARAAARIHHPNVMAIHRVGELDGHPYIVAEYVRGTNLAEMDLPVDPEYVLTLGIGLARGLATAHRQGVLHRDIKLANAALSEDSDEVKLLDFSLAKVVADAAPTPSEERERPNEQPRRPHELADESSDRANEDLHRNVDRPDEGQNNRDSDTISLLPGDEEPAADHGGRTDDAVSGGPRTTDDPHTTPDIDQGVGADPLPGPTDPDTTADIDEDAEPNAAPDDPHTTADIDEDADPQPGPDADPHTNADIDEGADADTSLDPDPPDDEDATALIDADPNTGPRQRTASPDPGTLLGAAERVDDDWRRGTASLTQLGSLVGTPHYMAPELWRAEPASRETDIYALGVVLYILCVGAPPFAALSPKELKERDPTVPPVPVHEAAPAVDPRLAKIIERCLHAEPTERFHTGDALREALESLRAKERRPRSAADNPYRGLQAFEAEHRDLFFGRGAELRTVLDRLRSEPFVLVAGDSGVGKSSLCRAGVGPSVLDGAIEPERRWSCATMIPGRHPLRTLVSVLVSSFGFDHDVIRSAIDDRPERVGWLIHQTLGRTNGTLLFIDQFEELVTVSDRKEAEIVGMILSQFAAGIPGVRLLATVRGDFLTRAADIPSIGEELSRAIYLLRPLSEAGVREAIVGPAEAMGVRYESSTLVDELVASGIESSLPILQFALAELWEARDVESRVISASDLDGLGGVTGALAGHAERLMTSLLPRQRLVAKQLLLRLVTIDNTRASLPIEELAQDDEDSGVVLETLVRGRLLVVRENDEGTVYEIAHEALIREWSNLRRWLDEAAEIRALRHRLEVAASEWERLDRPNNVLWRAAQLEEAAPLDHASLRPHERAFITQSQRGVARGRIALRAAAVAIPTALALTYGLVRVQTHAELSQRVDARLVEAEAGLERAEASFDAFVAAQTAAFEYYDAGADEPAGQAHTEAKAHAQASDLDLAAAARELERALTLDPTRSDVRDRLGDALLERAELAERRGDEARVAELIERLSLYDESGERMDAWNTPARLSIETTPPGATVDLVEYRLDESRRRLASEPRPLGTSPLASIELPRGSYLLEVEVEGRPPVRYPLRLGRAEAQSVSIEIPAAEAIPPGFVFIPRGAFLLGCANETLCQTFYESAPIHQATTEAYLIGQHEVTYREWIDFLEDTPVQDRAALTPGIDQGFVPVSLAPVEGGGWSLTFPREDQDVEASMGELLTFEQRDRRQSQDWLQMPVLAINFELASAYLDWLDRTGRVPGARHCTDQQWERAGRGADGRLFPHGDHVDPDDMNIDMTYGKRSETMGPDVAGSHPVSRSPFGVDDLAGNAAEWTVDPLHDDGTVLRGGAFAMDPMQAHLVTRQPISPDFIDGAIGMRVCAPFPLPRPIGTLRDGSTGKSGSN